MIPAISPVMPAIIYNFPSSLESATFFAFRQTNFSNDKIVTVHSGPCHLNLAQCWPPGIIPGTLVNPKLMKIKIIAGSALALLLVAGGVVGCATEEQKEAALQAQAKISKADAQKTALAKVPN